MFWGLLVQEELNKKKKTRNYSCLNYHDKQLDLYSTHFILLKAKHCFLRLWIHICCTQNHNEQKHTYLLILTDRIHYNFFLKGQQKRSHKKHSKY